MNPQTRNIIFCFDGTGNEPSDAKEEPTAEQDPGGLTNVAKLHLLLGGDFTRDATNSFYDMPNQVSLYYSGVGTYGGPFRKALNYAFACQDVRSIIKEALEDLRRLYKPNDRVFVVGFSRGAAIARKFCAVVSQKMDLSHVTIEMLIAFDTVASLGMPDFSSENRPSSDVLFENRKVAQNLKQALHCVSIDDKRQAYQPTLMNAENRVTEVWFAGNHGDVGGGWYNDGLADVALQFVLDEIKKRKMGLLVLTPGQVKLQHISDATSGVDIELDDIDIQPDPHDITHEQKMLPWHYHRRVVVIENDQIVTDKLPILHSSVVDRIVGRSEQPLCDDMTSRDYRPQSLGGQPHAVLYSDGSIRAFSGLNGHMKPLQPGDSCVVSVCANRRFNRTRLLLREGEHYRFTPNLSQHWQDGPYVCNAAGWDRLHMLPFRPLKRFRGANWFSLIGAIKGDDKENPNKAVFFEIGAGPMEYKAEMSGEFCPFANDAKNFYCNNKGFVDVEVECLPLRSNL